MSSSPGTRLRAERQSRWEQLDVTLTHIEQNQSGQLTNEDLIALPGLYRTVVASLAVVRSGILDNALRAYLESLTRRAYFVVYGVDETLGQRLKRFIRKDWRLAVYDIWPEFLVSMMLIALGTLAGWALVSRDPKMFFALLPEQLIAGRTPDASHEFLEHSLFSDNTVSDLIVFSAHLFTHNAEIAFLAFSLGFALGIPTATLLLYQGGTMGAFLAVFAKQHLALPFVGWLSIHGVTEILAVALAGAAGLRIGRSLAQPNGLGHWDALRRQGRTCGMIVMGATLMLIGAGLLEGLGREMIHSTPLRFVIGGGTLWAWKRYLFPHPPRFPFDRLFKQ